MAIARKTSSVLLPGSFIDAQQDKAQITEEFRSASSGISFIVLIRQRQQILDAIRQQLQEIAAFKESISHNSHLFNE